MKILIANWKANPPTLAEAQELFEAEIIEAAKYKNIQTVICPPFVYLEELAKKLKTENPEKASGPRGFTGWELETVSLGAQDVFWERSGPFTGEVSAEMLKNFGVKYVLVGHSDRRYKIGETDEIINKKIKAALRTGIVPVLLVGEKNRGDDRKMVLEKQLSVDLDGLTAEQIAKILIAYEPVWAISPDPGLGRDRGSSIRETNRDTQSNRAATPEYTLEAIGIINEILSITYNQKPVTCLYGGSVIAKNIASFLSHPEISGAVIGGASLRKDEFAEMLRIVSKIR